MADKAKQYGYVTKRGNFVNTKALESYATKVGDSDQSRKIPEDTFSTDYGRSGLVPPLYNPEALARVLEINTYHYRACKTKARDTAGLGWTLSPKTDNPNEAQKETADEFFQGLSQPLSIILDRVMLDHEAIGYACLELIREGYAHDAPPIDLDHIPSHTMRIHKDGARACQIRGNRKRWFKLAGEEIDVDYETGEVKPIGEMDESRRASEVIWILNYTPRSDYYGLPDFIPALGAIHGDLARRDYNITFFDNFGVPAYAVFVTGNFDPGEADETGRTELEKSIEGHFQELAKNPHSTLVLTVPSNAGDSQNDVKINFQPLAVEVKEASFRLYRTDNRDEVLASHGVPPYRMGIAETGSLGGDTAVETTEIYKRSIIQPRQEVLEALFNLHIIGQHEDIGLGIDDYTWELGEIDTTDEAHDVDMVKAMFDMGAMSPNNIAEYFGERFGLARVEHPAMDAHYVQGQPITLDKDSDDAEAVKSVLRNVQDRLLETAAKTMDEEEFNRTFKSSRGGVYR